VTDRETRMWPVTGVAFGVLWLFVRGAELAPEALLGSFALGTAVGMPLAYLSRRLYADAIDLSRIPRALPYVALYLVAFIREVIVANLDVAYRVLAPSMPIEPEVILVPLRVETDLGITTIANSITITPGTLTLDYDPEENALYVHVIDGRDPSEIVDPIRTWEDYALGWFDEEDSPDDPAAPIAVYPPEEPTPPAVETGEAGGESGESGDRNPDDAAEGPTGGNAGGGDRSGR